MSGLKRGEPDGFMLAECDGRDEWRERRLAELKESSGAWERPTLAQERPVVDSGIWVGLAVAFAFTAALVALWWALS